MNKANIVLKSLVAICAAALLVTTAVPGASSKAFAGVADNGGWWQTWNGLYVGTIHEVGNGNVKVRFLNNQGDAHKGWTYSGTNVCSNTAWLMLSSQHPQRDQITKTVMAAGLAQRPVYVVMQPVGGTCYLKQIQVEFRKANDD